MERAAVVKHADNLRVEGKMEGRSNLNQTFILEQGERASKVKHADNLKMEGSMSMQRQEAAVSKGERHAVVRREDNLKMEGAFAGRVKDTSSTRKLSNASTVTIRSENRDKSNILIGDDASAASTSKAAMSAIVEKSSKSAKGSSTSQVLSKKTAQSSNQESSFASSVAQSSNVVSKSAMESSTTAKSASSQALRANISTGLQGALLQSGKTSAEITAVNNDKFASSLRETSASAIGQQKEMSVIEHHRKQSLQKQRNDYSGGGAGYELNAHTGRTAAFGGRDYEYSTTLVGGGRRAESSSRTTTQDYGARSSTSRQSVTAATAKQSFSGSSMMRQEASSSAAYQSTAQSSYRAQGQQVINVKFINLS